MQQNPWITIPQDTMNFIERWKAKRCAYSLERLEDYFDRFFTSFVLYNFLYDELCLRLDFKWKKDNEKATKAVTKFLGAETIFADPIIREGGATLRRLVESRSFYVRDQVWDDERIKKLTAIDSEQWTTGLLEIVYAIRCNTFHGSKAFEEGQRAILNPCVVTTERLCDLIIERMHET